MKANLRRLFSGRSMTAVLMTVVLSISFFNANADGIRYSDSWGRQGLSLNRQATDGLSLNFSIREFDLASRTINGESMIGIEFSESFLQNEEG